jgi:hypothetical protein
MYLVRSVKLAELSMTEMRRTLVEHFSAPLQGAEGKKTLIDLCESGFKRDGDEFHGPGLADKNGRAPGQGAASARAGRGLRCIAGPRRAGMLGLQAEVPCLLVLGHPASPC